MEINVFSPGASGSAQSLVEVDFAPIIIEELERKVRIRKHNPGWTAEPGHELSSIRPRLPSLWQRNQARTQWWWVRRWRVRSPRPPRSSRGGNNRGARGPGRAPRRRRRWLRSRRWSHGGEGVAVEEQAAQGAAHELAEVHQGLGLRGVRGGLVGRERLAGTTSRFRHWTTRSWGQDVVVGVGLGLRAVLELWPMNG